MPQFGGKDSKCHFTVVMGGKEHGLYVSSTPSSAARKAVTKLCAANKSKKVEFHIREITQGSKKKTYGPYEGHIEKLKEPIELKGRVIKYKPVAKLSGKTGAKKGGMRRGGVGIYECKTKIPGTNYSFKIEQKFVPTSKNNPYMYGHYVLTLINNDEKNNNKNNLLERVKHGVNEDWKSHEVYKVELFNKLWEDGKLVEFLNSQNRDFSIILSRDENTYEKSRVSEVLDKLLFFYFDYRHFPISIEDNTSEYQKSNNSPNRFIDRKEWLKRIFRKIEPDNSDSIRISTKIRKY